MPYATSKGIDIYYEQHGEGPDVMLIHGSGGHHAAWFQQVPYFSRYYRVTLVDLRGFGLSDTVEGGPDALDFDADMEAVLDHAGVGRVALIAQSLGGTPSLRLLVRNPSRIAGALLAHSLGNLDDEDVRTRAAADRAEAIKLPVVDRLMTKAFQQANPEMKWLFHASAGLNPARLEDIRNHGAPGPTPAEVAATGVRLHFLAGEKDAVISNETTHAAQSRITGATMSVVPEAPHSMYWECPQLFNAAVHTFLKEIYPAAR